MSLAPKRKLFVLCFVAALATLNASCGKDTAATTTSVNPLNTTTSTLAVTSPTAETSTSLTRNSKPTFYAWITKKIAGFFFMDSIADTAPETVVQPFETMAADLASDLNSATPAQLAADVGQMSVSTYSAPCYGPSWTDNATGSSVNRPSNDLGLVANAASTTDTTACSVAQLNSLIGGAPQFANKIVRLQATLVSALKTAGTALPAVGASVDALANMPTFTGFTLTAATLSRLADDASGNEVYKTLISFTDTNSKTGTVTVYHTPLDDNNTTYKGLIKAVLPYTATMGGTGTKRGLSMVYHQDATTLTYALDTAANRSVDSSDFFSTTTGRIDFSKTSFGEDGNRIIASFNTSTDEATMHYAWQAGSSDGAVRAFAVNISKLTDGTMTGFAYYGFGAAISTLTDNVSSPWMTKMHCNWLNGLSSSASITKVQGQKFTQTSGQWVPTENYIAFAPTDSCTASSWTISNNTTYAGTRTTATHSLISVGDIGTVPAVTVPTYTLPE